MILIFSDLQAKGELKGKGSGTFFGGRVGPALLFPAGAGRAPPGGRSWAAGRQGSTIVGFPFSACWFRFFRLYWVA